MHVKQFIGRPEPEAAMRMPNASPAELCLRFSPVATYSLPPLPVLMHGLHCYQYGIVGVHVIGVLHGFGLKGYLVVLCSVQWSHTVSSHPKLLIGVHGCQLHACMLIITYSFLPYGLTSDNRWLLLEITSILSMSHEHSVLTPVIFPSTDSSIYIIWIGCHSILSKWHTETCLLY